MSIDTSTVNWSLFTKEEQEAIERLIKLNVREYITGGVVDMTPAKEAEIQKIVDAMRPNTLIFESKVLKEDDIAKVKAGLPTGPQTPAEEAELQAKLDAELAEFQAKEAHKHLEQNKNLEIVTKFCNSCDSLGGRHKKNCSRIVTPQVKIIS